MRLNHIAIFAALSMTSFGYLHANHSAVNPGHHSYEIRNAKLLERLNKLPEKAKSRALERLEALKVPAEDHFTIDVDNDGEIFYIEKAVDDLNHIEPLEAESDLPGSFSISSSEAFNLHSKPESNNKIYLDFDGHTITGTAWNNYTGVGTLYGVPFDKDGNPNGWSEQELKDIAHIWHRIAEDFAPFDVDVTTELPATIGPNTGRILITKDIDANGQQMPAYGAGGVAYLGVWGRSNYEYYSPALVYYDNLGSGNVHYVSEAASHEIGHNFGLSHDGKTDGTSYYTGHGSGYLDWAPIMGVGYSGHVTQWSKGEYALANNTEDDIQIIKDKLGNFSLDDHGNTTQNATLLVVNQDGTILSTNPETDTSNVHIENKGVIETETDVDVFMFDAGMGPISFTITPAWAAYYTSGYRGSNLDIKATLSSADGTVIAQSSNTSDTQATILVESAPSGTFYLKVFNESTGDGATGFTDYASLGQYFIEGNVVSSETGERPTAKNDEIPVAEDSFQKPLDVLANDTGVDGSTLTITDVTNAQFGIVSLANNQITYTPEANYNGSDSFTYRVVDEQGLSSNVATVTIDVYAVNDEPISSSDSANLDRDTSTLIDVLANDTDIDGDTLEIIIVNSSQNANVSVEQGKIRYTPQPGFVGQDSLTYYAQDPAGATSDTTTVSITVNDVLPPPNVPTGLATSDGGSGQAVISWDGVNSSERYDLERQRYSSKGKGKWVDASIISNLSGNTTSYSEALSNGTYRYRVRSANASGVSSWSAWVELTMSSNVESNTKGRGKKNR